MEQLMFPEETAHSIGIKLVTLYTWVSRGKIPFVKVGAKLMFRPSALEAWLREREHQPKRTQNVVGM